VRLLLDTVAFIWAVGLPERISKPCSTADREFSMSFGIFNKDDDNDAD